MRVGLRTVAVFEAAKGVVVLLAGFGVFALVHSDLQDRAARVVEQLHLNPARTSTQVFLDLAANLTDTHLRWLALFALVYSVLRFVEAFGLWRERRWAEWFAVLSGTVYVPFELYELAHGVTGLKVAALGLNVLVVLAMSWVLLQSGRSAASPRSIG